MVFFRRPWAELAFFLAAEHMNSAFPQTLSIMRTFSVGLFSWAKSKKALGI